MTRILVIDDDLDFLNVMDQGLRIQQFEVVTSQDPMEALRLITEFTFDSILTDLGMPRMTGIQLISYIKASEKNRETPIFVISGQDLGSAPLEELKVVKVIPKPFSFPHLIDALNEATERRRTTRRPIAYSPALISNLKMACTEILEFYTGEPLIQGNAFIKLNPDRVYDHYGMICLFGRRLFGSMALSCESSFLERILARLFVGQTFNTKDVEALAQETFLEIINQVAGRFKQLMLAKLVTFNIGLPEYARAECKAVKHKVSGHTLCVPLALKDQKIQLEICLGFMAQDLIIEDSSFEIFLTKET